MDEQKVSAAIVEALRDFGVSDEAREDIAFHMVDWSKDLAEWNGFCDSPESFTPEEVRDLLLRFLLHVPAHVAAASKLLTGEPVGDVFEVGAVANE